MKYVFLFNRKERKGKRKVPQRYILKLCDLCGELCDLCGSFLRCRNSNCVAPMIISRSKKFVVPPSGGLACCGNRLI